VSRTSLTRSTLNDASAYQGSDRGVRVFGPPHTDANKAGRSASSLRPHAAIPTGRWESRARARLCVRASVSFLPQLTNDDVAGKGMSTRKPKRRKAFQHSPSIRNCVRTHDGGKPNRVARVRKPLFRRDLRRANGGGGDCTRVSAFHTLTLRVDRPRPPKAGGWPAGCAPTRVARAAARSEFGTPH
jgi:hypothetical protein